MRARTIVLLLLIAACGSQTEYFRPTEAQSGSEEGHPAAAYDLNVAGARLGEARVWSAGAYEGEVDGVDRTLIHTSVEVENTSDTPIVVETDKTRLEAVSTDKRVLGATTPAAVYAERGRTVVSPGETARFDLHFALPKDIGPQEVDAFRLRWSVAARGQEYTQVTPFDEFEPPTTTYAYGPYPFYDPFWDPYFGPYFGPPGYYPYVVRQVDVQRPIRDVTVREHRTHHY